VSGGRPVGGGFSRCAASRAGQGGRRLEIVAREQRERQEAGRRRDPAMRSKQGGGIGGQWFSWPGSGVSGGRPTDGRIRDARQAGGGAGGAGDGQRWERVAQKQ
jgi:hypothetical protein